LLVALSQKGERVLSHDAEKGRFYQCQQCGGRLIFKKGRIKIPHFAHYPYQNPCNVWEAESSRHLQMKYIAMANIVKDNRFSFVEYEYNIDGYFPDIYGEITDYNGKKWKLAVEMQKSNKSVEDFIEKTRFYTKRDIYTLWIFDYPKAWDKKISRVNRKKGYLKYYEVRVNAMLRESQRLNDGRVYMLRDYLLFSNHLYPVYRQPNKRLSVVKPNNKRAKVLKTVKKPVMKVLGAWNIMFTTTIEGLKIAKFRDKPFWED